MSIVTALSQAVIFTATKRGADKLSKQLVAQGHKSAALHGDMGQGARKRTVEQMRRGQHSAYWLRRMWLLEVLISMA